MCPHPRYRWTRAWLLAAAWLSAGAGCNGGGGGGGTDGGAGTGGSTAGAIGNAGTSGSAGAAGTAANGGTIGSGGVSPTAGTMGTGGASGRGGGAGAAGASGRGGGAGSAGAGGAGGPRCKRGIAANTAPGPAFFPAVTWWYNWALTGTGAGAGIEFVPMMWDEATVNRATPAGSKFLLGFNEPNFMAQANLTAQAAAGLWPMLQASARNASAAIVSPALNFCGPAAECNGTDPFQYMKDFFAACAGCQVDHVAVHWYNCDLPSLRDYLEPGGNLQGWEQFGKPIWLTEFSCNPGDSVAQNEAFMRLAIPYLEANPNVFRYSWFSANPIPNARLINSDGTPTALGQVYISLPQNCP